MALAAFAMLSACETVELKENLKQDNISVSGTAGGAEAKVIFTATLGADTKTYLDYDAENNVYKTVWDEDDHIWITDPATGNYEYCTLISGAGTSVGEFAGSIEADSYIAVYGMDCWWNEDHPSIYMDNWFWTDQLWDSENGEYINRLTQFTFPMAAQSKSTSFEFKNLCSILKLSIKGNQYLNEIYVRSNDGKPMSGRAEVIFDGSERPALSFLEDETYSYVNVGCGDDLYRDRTYDLYVAIPSGEYPSGISVELWSSGEYKTVSTASDIVFEPSQIRSFPVISYYYESGDTWGLSGEMTQWADGADIPMTFEEGFYVLRNQYIGYGVPFKFRRNGVWDGSELGMTSYMSEYYGVMPTNTCVSLENYANIILRCSGYYDIYLDPYSSKVYIMSAGLSVNDLPTAEEVSCYTYNDMMWGNEAKCVMVGGRVMAKNEYGFVLRLFDYYLSEDRSIFVNLSETPGYSVEVGNYVDLYAHLRAWYDYNDGRRVELDSVEWLTVVDAIESDYADYGYNLLNPDDFDGFYTEYCAYYTTSGTLEYEEDGFYYVTVNESHYPRVRLIAPVQDLSELVGQVIYMEGYVVDANIPASDEGYCLDTVLKYVSPIRNEGGTENIRPGDDVILTGTLK